jgi:hypothetical protein
LEVGTLSVVERGSLQMRSLLSSSSIFELST